MGALKLLLLVLTSAPLAAVGNHIPTTHTPTSGPPQTTRLSTSHDSTPTAGSHVEFTSQAESRAPSFEHSTDPTSGPGAGASQWTTDGKRVSSTRPPQGRSDEALGLTGAAAATTTTAAAAKPETILPGQSGTPNGVTSEEPGTTPTGLLRQSGSGTDVTTEEPGTAPTDFLSQSGTPAAVTSEEPGTVSADLLGQSASTAALTSEEPGTASDRALHIGSIADETATPSTDPTSNFTVAPKPLSSTTASTVAEEPARTGTPNGTTTKAQSSGATETTTLESTGTRPADLTSASLLGESEWAEEQPLNGTTSRPENTTQSPISLATAEPSRLGSAHVSSSPHSAKNTPTPHTDYEPPVRSSSGYSSSSEPLFDPNPPPLAESTLINETGISITDNSTPGNMSTGMPTPGNVTTNRPIASNGTTVPIETTSLGVPSNTDSLTVNITETPNILTNDFNLTITEPSANTTVFPGPLHSTGNATAEDVSTDSSTDGPVMAEEPTETNASSTAGVSRRTWLPSESPTSTRAPTQNRTASLVPTRYNFPTERAGLTSPGPDNATGPPATLPARIPTTMAASLPQDEKPTFQENPEKVIRIEVGIAETSTDCRPEVNVTSDPCLELAALFMHEAEVYYKMIDGFLRIRLAEEMRKGSVIIPHEVAYDYVTMRPEDEGLAAAEVYQRTLAPAVAMGQLGGLALTNCSTCDEPRDETDFCEAIESGLATCQSPYLEPQCADGYVACRSPCKGSPDYCSGHGACSQADGEPAVCRCQDDGMQGYRGDRCQDAFNKFWVIYGVCATLIVVFVLSYVAIVFLHKRITSRRSWNLLPDEGTDDEDEKDYGSHMKTLDYSRVRGEENEMPLNDEEEEYIYAENEFP